MESHISSLSTHLPCCLEDKTSYLLCIPSTPAPSERVLSTAEHTITKLRASLNSANTTDLIFLHNSWLIVEVYEAENEKKRKR